MAKNGCFKEQILTTWKMDFPDDIHLNVGNVTFQLRTVFCVVSGTMEHETKFHSTGSA